MYLDIGSQKSAAEFASRFSQAVYTYAKAGTPMLTLTTAGGTVSSSMTSASVAGTGLGGFDSVTPGSGLDAVRPKLQSDLLAAFTHGNHPGAAIVFAQKISLAIHGFYSQAKIQTIDTSGSPLPASNGPTGVTGVMTGSGGTLTNAPGSGLDAALPAFKSSLQNTFGNVGSLVSAPEKVKLITDAIYTFLTQAIITSTGTMTASATVASGSGTYAAGTGTSTGTVS